MKKRSFHCQLKPIVFVILFQCLCACGDQKADRIVDAAIQAHGGAQFESFFLTFDFRERHYTAARDGGIFAYTRQFKDSTGMIKDVLDNGGFTRYRDDVALPLADDRSQAFSRSVNSVIYFSLLPFGLNDDAVNKRWLKETTIEGEPYDVVRVTFDQTGGGEDHEDVFLYWFHQEHNTMDYLAYSFHTEGGGLRFRKAINPRRKGNILIQDYINYKPKDETVSIEALERKFIAGDLDKLSEIKITNEKVTDYPR